MINRIKAVDGLRAVAVIGVVWAHVWMFAGNPAWKIFKIDTHRIISFGGSGVDLFFVISGFCMYLMLSRKVTFFTPRIYYETIRRRWLRIAPAFYTTAILSAVLYFAINRVTPLYDVLAHFFFLHTILPETGGLSAPFWSLATEWQFYLALPLFFSKKFTTKYFHIWCIFLLMTSILFRYAIYQYGPTQEGIWKPNLPFRFCEFVLGVIACRIYIEDIEIPRLLKGFVGFCLAFGIAFIGRLMMVAEVLNFMPSVLFPILKAFAEPVMCLGFAMIVLNVLRSSSIFGKLLETRFATFSGKLSYSIYLIHWWPCYYITKALQPMFENDILLVWVSFIISLVVIYPLSFISYTLLEKRYFKKQHEVRLSSV